MYVEEKTVEAWHFLCADRRLRYGFRQLVAPGSLFAVLPPLELCYWGLHASVRAFDALNYAPGPVVCRVKVWGQIERGMDKLCGEFRHVEWMADASEALHTFACDMASDVLDAIEAKDRAVAARSRRAIEVKRAWLRGEATDEELKAACDAARYAARSAAEAAAWSAAPSAAEAAAPTAAWYAARDAAGYAAWYAARDAQNQRVHDALMGLRPA